jgi:hypothetical protein
MRWSRVTRRKSTFSNGSTREEVVKTNWKIPLRDQKGWTRLALLLGGAAGLGLVEAMKHL